MVHLKLINKQFNSKGFSLVEVVASIVILSIIVVSVLSLIIQSAKTTKTSENMIDATYIAQTEMEKAYTAATENKLSSLDEQIQCLQIELGYPADSPIVEGDIRKIQRTIISEGNTELFIQIELKQHTTLKSLTPIIISVYEQKDGRFILKAQMQNTLAWKG